MTRAIDANAMLNELRPISFETEHSAVLLSDVSKMMREWVERQPTITPPNEWVSRALELDELYTKLQTVTGFTAEQLLEMFAAGYTLEKPDYSKHFEAMANLAESDPPNEPLTCEGCYWQTHGSFGQCFGCFREKTDNYRRPLEGEEDA